MVIMLGVFTAGVWQFLLSVLTPHEGSRFMRLRRVSCAPARLKAWICSALNERSLERYFRVRFSLISILYKLMNEVSGEMSDYIKTLYHETGLINLPVDVLHSLLLLVRQNMSNSSTNLFIKIEDFEKFFNLIRTGSRFCILERTGAC